MWMMSEKNAVNSAVTCEDKLKFLKWPTESSCLLSWSTPLAPADAEVTMQLKLTSNSKFCYHRLPHAGLCTSEPGRIHPQNQTDWRMEKTCTLWIKWVHDFRKAACAVDETVRGGRERQRETERLLLVLVSVCHKVELKGVVVFPESNI